MKLAMTPRTGPWVWTKICEAIDFLVKDKGLSSDEAYMLASVAVDFAITQLVDDTVGVHGMIPKGIVMKK